MKMLLTVSETIMWQMVCWGNYMAHSYGDHQHPVNFVIHPTLIKNCKWARLVDKSVKPTNKRLPLIKDELIPLICILVTVYKWLIQVISM